MVDRAFRSLLTLKPYNPNPALPILLTLTLTLPLTLQLPLPLPLPLPLTVPLSLTLSLGIPGASTLNFFVDFPAEATRNDVTLPEGRVFFRGPKP